MKLKTDEETTADARAYSSSMLTSAPHIVSFVAGFLDDEGNFHWEFGGSSLTALGIAHHLTDLCAESHMECAKDQRKEDE